MFKEGYEPAFLSDSSILNPFNHVIQSTQNLELLLKEGLWWNNTNYDARTILG